MNFTYEPALQTYIKKHNKKTLVVEMVEVNNSDFEITELSVRFIDERMRKIFVEQRRYRVFPTEFGEVLLPRFPLEMEETVTFGLKKVLFFNIITYNGIKV